MLSLIPTEPVESSITPSEIPLPASGEILKKITWAENFSANIEAILAAAAEKTEPTPDASSQNVPSESQTAPQITDYAGYCEAVRVEPYDEIDRAIEEATGTIVTMNEATFFTDGREAAIEMLHAIQSAVEKIKINVYAWHGDSSGLKFVKALKKRNNPLQDDTRKQPQMEVVVDLLGSLMVGSIQGFQDPKVLAKMAKQLFWNRKPENLKDWVDLLSGKILTEVGEPVLNVWKIMKGIANPDALNSFTAEEEECLEALTRRILTQELLTQLNPSVRSLADAGINLKISANSLSKMDHTKIFVFDNRCLVTGTNLSDYYSGQYHQNTGWSDADKDIWHDYAVMLKGPAVQLIESLFFNHQDFTIPPPGETGSPETLSPIRILENKPGKFMGTNTHPDFAKEKQITYTILKWIESSKEEIILDQAYMMDESVTAALIHAAHRGVKIKIIKGKPEAVNLEYSIGKYLSRLNAVKGVEIFQSEDVSHAKCISVDKKRSLTGSVNLSTGSLYYNREIALATSGDSPLQKAISDSLKSRLEKVQRINFNTKERLMGLARAVL